MSFRNLSSDFRLLSASRDASAMRSGGPEFLTEKFRASAAWVHLTEARRFKERPAILALATALENLDAEGAAALLSEAKGSAAPKGLAWLEIPGNSLSWSAFPQPIQVALTAVADAKTPEAAMEALGKICVLTAQREPGLGADDPSVSRQRV